MGQAVKEKSFSGNRDKWDIILIGKIYKSFEALEETLGKLQLEEPVYYIIQKIFCRHGLFSN